MGLPPLYLSLLAVGYEVLVAAEHERSSEKTTRTKQSHGGSPLGALVGIPPWADTAYTAGHL